MAVAVEAKPVHELLETISDAFTSAKEALPEDASAFEPPSDGISLLDVKTDLLLSYLQHLVFLVLFKLDKDSSLGSDVVRKLIELRAFLERGVRPLETRLKYQIDKVLRAADDADRQTAQKALKPPKVQDVSDSDLSASESEASDQESDDARHGPGDFAKISTAARAQTKTKQRSSDGIYRPPRQNAVSMPSRSTDDVPRRRKNALLDEFINEEHSSAPMAQPSIGSNNTITDRGRQHSALNSRDRAKERERRDYEERNFVRLPGASKTEKKKEKARQAREGRDMFGGEDWTGLGGMGDRIRGTVKGKGNLLERREKRKRDTVDSPRGDGVGIGETFEKRRRVLQDRLDKKSRR